MNFDFSNLIHLRNLKWFFRGLAVGSVSIYFAPPAGATTLQYENTVSVGEVVPDGSATGVFSRADVTADFRTIGFVTVHFETSDYQNAVNGDLYAYLSYSSLGSTPTNQISILLNRPGTTNASNAADVGSFTSSFNVVFSNDGRFADIHTGISTVSGSAVTGTWQADGRSADPSLVETDSPRDSPLSSFNGLDPNGHWTLFVADLSGGGTSKFENWGLTITAPSQLSVTSGTTTFANTNNAYNGPVNISSGATLAVTSSGTMTAMTSINVNGGTLLLTGEGTQRINNAAGEAPVLLSGGGVIRANAAGQIVENFGALTVTNGGVLDFGSGTTSLNFAASDAAVWTGLLSVWNWSGGSVDQLAFGNSATGLTMDQLNSVKFYSDNGQTFLGTGGIMSNGQLAAVPEATAVLVPALLLAGAAWREGRRKR